MKVLPQLRVEWGKIALPIEQNSISREELNELIHFHLGMYADQFYLLSNGKKVTSNPLSGKIDVIVKLRGGKGGFGSMLRAIGAQIEKTTNREACRDLSGRRLRDINKEQRLKKWVAQQADREKEEKEKKKKKLEKMLEEPKYDFKDEDYDKNRSDLPEKIENAVLQGLEASCSGLKRKSENGKGKAVPKKKPKLWLDSELDDDLSVSSEDDISETSEKELIKTTGDKCINSDSKDKCKNEGTEESENDKEKEVISNSTN
ncbi:splicing regulator SDE2-like [Euwallacea fornicatus]|uniref:splicing regulator SDE2-like n=1 Tax=Euwallacea fornicatus TaxID=995702 RepID=UPI00338EFAFD